MTEKPNRFINLHAHTHASVGDGLGPVDEHIDFCLENGMESMAFTEHGNCNSFAQAYLKTQELNKKGRNFKLIAGCEAYYHPDLEQWKRDKFSHEERKKIEKDRKKEEKKKSSEQIREELSDDGDGSTTENEDETKDVSKWRNPVTRRHHMVLLAKSEKGLENLFKLVSRSQTEGMYRFPRIDARMLKEHGEDIIVTSACVDGNAIVTTNNGKATLRELVESVNRGEVNFIKSFNEVDQKDEYRQVLAGQLTKKNAKVLKIKLKDGRILKCTPDHKVLTSNGWKEAQHLSKEDKILCEPVEEISK